jgi:Peptidase C39 family/Tetratricopeptide repeat
MRHDPLSGSDVTWFSPLRVLQAACCISLLTSCATITPRSQPASSSALVIPNVPLLKWGIESCGAGSLSTVLQHYGDATSLAAWDATLPKTRGGVMTIDMLLAARQKGFDAQLVTGTPQLVEEELRAGHPVILMVQVIDSPGHHYDFFHYVVADGLDPSGGLIRTQWGDQRGRWTSFARIEKSWSGGGHAAIVIRPLTDDRQFSTALRDAVSREDAGDYTAAAQRYRDLLTAHPDSLLLWTNLGNAEMQLHHNAGAETAFRRALALDATSRDTLNNLAWLLLGESRLDEAESLARQAVAQGGADRYLVLDTLARVLAAKGDCPNALATFHEAIDAVPPSRSDARQDLEKGLRAATQGCRG